MAGIFYPAEKSLGLDEIRRESLDLGMDMGQSKRSGNKGVWRISAIVRQSATPRHGNPSFFSHWIFCDPPWKKERQLYHPEQPHGGRTCFSADL